MLNTLVEYIRGLPIKDWGGTIIGGLIALAGVAHTNRLKAKLAKDQRVFDAAKTQREGDRTLDIAQTQDLTARFKALMDGYEARIVDLTTALRQSHDENRELRADNDRLREKFDAS